MLLVRKRVFCDVTSQTFPFFEFRKGILFLCQIGKRFESLFFLFPQLQGGMFELIVVNSQRLVIV